MRLAFTIGAVTLALAGPAAAAPARIVFSSDDQLWTMNADGSAATRLTHLGPRQEAYQPAWSPDGSLIAFTSRGHRIWTIRSDGSDARRLTPREQRNTYETSPAWSPDGTRIAFARSRFAHAGLRISIVVTDGTHERTVAKERLRQLGYLAEPEWSPDGRRLVFTRSVVDEHAYFEPKLLSIAIDGSDKRVLAADAQSASFSPDGTRIAFASVRDHNGSDCGSDECYRYSELYVMNADGSAPTRLTRTKGDEQSPDWSPDGGRIAFDSTRNFPRGESPEVYSIAPDGSCLTWLTNGTADSAAPDWEPGASLSSDPGACGAADRPPLATVDVEAATARIKRFKPFWLGPVFGQSLLLSGAEGGDLYYDDCASFDPAACAGPLSVLQVSTCDEPFRKRYVQKLQRIRGALVFDGRGGVDIYTGSTALHLFGLPSRDVPAAVAALRPVGAAAPPASLTPPALAARVWRRADRATRARLRRLGARRKHCPYRGYRRR